MSGFKDFVTFGPYKTYCKHLLDVCKEKNLSIEEIGKAGDHPLFCIEVNNKSEHTICISAGIHGDEIAGPWAVLKLLEEVKLKGLDYNYIIFPVGNPTGFDMGTRRNHLRRDLNRHFRDKELTGENKILHDAIKGRKLCLFYSLHEHPKAKGFYLYCSADIDPQVTAKMLIVSRKHRFKTRTNHFGQRIPKGEVRLHKLDGDRSFEDRMFKEKVPYIVIETPGTANLQKRIKLQFELLKSTVEKYEVKNLCQ